VVFSQEIGNVLPLEQFFENRIIYFKLSKMKKKLFSLTLLAVIMGMFATAQSFKDELDVVQSTWGKNKKALTQDFLQLSTEEAAAFSPIYDAYLESRKKITQVRGEVMEAFAAKNAQLDDETAKDMVTKLMKNNSNLASLQSKTFKKLSKALSPAKAAQWWQLESYIDSEIRAAILGELPLLEPVKK
jgi:formyltetrahydrofolate synthetase